MSICVSKRDIPENGTLLLQEQPPIPGKPESKYLISFKKAWDEGKLSEYVLWTSYEDFLHSFDLFTKFKEEYEATLTKSSRKITI